MSLSVAQLREVDSQRFAFGATAGDRLCLFGPVGAGASESVVAMRPVEWS
ncbi:MAG: hypothetical protein P9E67_14540 [Candidatus Competibacter sp.]|nr:hypothetical protein [Candidatus Competibacter sp.]